MQLIVLMHICFDTRFSLAHLVRQDHTSGANLAPVDLVLKRRPWIAGGEPGIDDSSEQEHRNEPQKQQEQQQEQRALQHHQEQQVQQQHQLMHQQQQAQTALPSSVEQGVDMTTSMRGRAPSPVVRETSPDMAPVLLHTNVERMTQEGVHHSRATASAPSEPPEANVRTRERSEVPTNGLLNGQTEAVMTQWSPTAEHPPSQVQALAASHAYINGQHTAPAEARHSCAESTGTVDELRMPRADAQAPGQGATRPSPQTNVSPRTNPSFSVKERAAQMQAQYFAAHNSSATSIPPPFSRKSSAGSNSSNSARGDAACSAGADALHVPAKPREEEGAQVGDLMTPARRAVTARTSGTSPDDSPLPPPPGVKGVQWQSDK